MSWYILQVSGNVTSTANTTQSMSVTVLHRNVLSNIHTCHTWYHKSHFKKSCTNLLEWLWGARRLVIPCRCPKTPDTRHQCTTAVQCTTFILATKCLKIHVYSTIHYTARLRYNGLGYNGHLDIVDHFKKSRPVSYNLPCKTIRL